MEFKDYLKVIRRRWPWLAGVMVMFVTIFSGFYVREEPQYAATAKLLIRIEVADQYIQEPFLRQQPGLSPSTREALLNSDPVLQDAVYLYGAQIALDRKLLKGSEGIQTPGDEEFFLDLFKLRKEGRFKPEDDQEKLRQDARDMVRNTVQRLAGGNESVKTTVDSKVVLRLLGAAPLPPMVGQAPAKDKFGDLLDTQSEAFRRVNDRLAGVKVVKSNEKLQFVNLTYQGGDPAEAVLLVNCVAYAGKDWSDRDTTESIDKAIANQEESQKTLSARKKDLGKAASELEDKAAERNIVQARISSLRQRRDQLATEQKKFEKMTASGKEKRHFDGMGFAPEPTTASDDVRTIERRLQDLAVQREQLLERHTEHAKDVRELDRQVAVLKKQLTAAKSQAEVDRQAYFAEQLNYYKEAIADVDQDLAESAKALAKVIEEVDQLRPSKEELTSIDIQLAKTTEVCTQLKTAHDTLKGFINVQKSADGATQQPKAMEKSWPFWLLMSAVVGLGVCYFREYLDTSIVTEYDVRRHLNLPVLGLIPELNTISQGKRLFSDDLVRAPLSETFNTIGTLVRTAMNQEGWKSILIASANPAEGKTFVSIQLALALARKGLKVILIDSDMRKPQIHATLGLENTAGLSNILEGGADPGPEGQPGSLEPFLQRTEIPNLEVITSGPVPQNPVQLLESQRMRDLLITLRERCDFILFDTPPICSVGDSITLATIVDMVLYVVGAGFSEQQDATWAKHLLNNVQANLLGVVMNRMEARRSREYYYYYTRDRKNVRPGV